MLSKFNSEVIKAIELIGNSEKSLENDELLKLLIQKGINENSAIEIVIFLPIAFVRKMLPNLNWHQNYIEQGFDKKQKTKSFAQNEMYKIIEIETENYYNENPKSDVIIKIAGRSAEFQAINKLLLKDDKADMAEIKFTETIVVRNN